MDPSSMDDVTIDEEEFQDFIESYYDEKVDIDDTANNKEWVRKKIGNLLRAVNQIDDRFDKVVIPAGCTKENLCSGEPTEFNFRVRVLVPVDITWLNAQSDGYTPRKYKFAEPPRDDVDEYGRSLDVSVRKTLDTLPVEAQVVSTDIREDWPAKPRYGYGYCSIDSKKIPKGWKDIVVGKKGEEADIMPFMVKRSFMKRLNEAEPVLRGTKTIIAKKINGSIINVTLFRETEPIHVTLQLFLDVEIPFHKWNNWPRDNIGWPHPVKALNVKNKGMILVPAGSFYWREDFAKAEEKLVENMDLTPLGNRRKVFRIVRQLNRDIFSNVSRDGTQILSNDDVKIIFLWVVEKANQVTDFSNGRVGRTVIAVLYRMLGVLQANLLPHYFDERIDLFKDKSQGDLLKVAAKIEFFLRNYVVLLQ